MQSERGAALFLLVISLVFTFMLVLASMPHIGKNDVILIQNKSNSLRLNEIKTALYGFVLTEGSSLGGLYRFPCPDVDGDGSEDLVAGHCVVQSGGLPWLTLSISAYDTWHQNYLYHVSADFSDLSTSFANASFANTLTGALSVFDSASLNTVLENDIALLFLSKGEPRSNNSIDELENLDMDVIYINRSPSLLSSNEFNDQLDWISRNDAVKFLCDIAFKTEGLPNCSN